MVENKSWEVLQVRAPADAAEAVAFALDGLGTLGTYYSIRARPSAENVVISGYFETRISNEKVKAALDDALGIFGLAPLPVASAVWQTVENQDWLAEWKKHWKPTITERFVVAPPWDEGEYPGKILIRIEPGMAFGTGTHETTRLCLNEIERGFRPGMSFLDVGTGTGILAIAADLLSGGGSKISACDTDGDAVAIAVENSRLNGAEQIGFWTGSVSAGTPAADFVCANLTTDTIKSILGLLVDKARKVLVLSGVLETRKEEIAEQLESMGLKPEIRVDGEWASLTVVRS